MHAKLETHGSQHVVNRRYDISSWRLSIQNVATVYTTFARLYISWICALWKWEVGSGSARAKTKKNVKTVRHWSEIIMGGRPRDFHLAFPATVFQLHRHCLLIYWLNLKLGLFVFAIITVCVSVLFPLWSILFSQMIHLMGREYLRVQEKKSYIKIILEYLYTRE